MALVSVICKMFVCVCVVLLSQPSSRVTINGFGICYVCVCVSRYLGSVVE